MGSNDSPIADDVEMLQSPMIETQNKSTTEEEDSDLENMFDHIQVFFQLHRTHGRIICI